MSIAIGQLEKAILESSLYVKPAVESRAKKSVEITAGDLNWVISQLDNLSFLLKTGALSKSTLGTLLTSNYWHEIIRMSINEVVLDDSKILGFIENMDVYAAKLRELVEKKEDIAFMKKFLKNNLKLIFSLYLICHVVGMSYNPGNIFYNLTHLDKVGLFDFSFDKLNQGNVWAAAYRDAFIRTTGEQ